MAICRFLRKLVPDNSRKSRTFFTVVAAASGGTSSLIQPPPLPFSPFSYRWSPLSKWFVPFHGPLFLSSPPWKLLQSATPLYLRGNGVVLRRVEALNVKLDRIRSRTKFPRHLGFRSGIAAEPSLVTLDRLGSKEEVGQGTSGIVDSFVNLPNLISMGRLASGPVLWWMISNEMYLSAFVGLAISGATDWLDGYMARRMRINSVVGSYLDPLADKVLIGCVAFAMVQKDLLHPALAGVVVLRDAALIGGAVYQRAVSLDWKWKSWADFVNLDSTSPQKVEPLFISKVNTVFQLVLVAAALLQPEFGNSETLTWITYLSWLVASTTTASTAAYGVQYMRKRTELLVRKS